MCGRFTAMYTNHELTLLMNLIYHGAALPPGFWERIEARRAATRRNRFNIAPTQDALVLTQTAAGEPDLVEMKWGIMPAWAQKAGPCNARSETAAGLPMFRSAFKQRRCIVPASGFYEWQKLGEKAKQPWYITRADGRPLLFAGLYESNDKGETFTVLTTGANEFMSAMHDRMPVVLEPERAKGWLDAPDDGLLVPASDGVLTAHPVSTRVNSPRNDDPSLVEPVQPVVQKPASGSLFDS